ncbi:MAG: SGNH/GDSL hydrolase family protein, partial [Clostridia bacterium]|nr:SGNH/GDSL hydrolase family protein [Clostridia bacterium]
MSRYLRITALVLVATMLLALVPFTTSAASVLTSKKIVCFGDSLTHFGDKSKPALGTDEYGNQVWQDDYPSHLATMLGTTVYNAGVGGHTTDDGLSRIDVEALAQNPDIMVICLGMNDQARAVATGINLTSIESYGKNLQIFVDKAKAKGVDVVFLTGTGTYKAAGYYQPGTADYSYGTNVADYMNVMREVAIKNNCGLVDALYEFSAMPPAEYFLAGDGLHHSNKGRQYFASLVAEYLKAVYDGTNKASMTIVCKDESGKQLAKYTINGASGAMITVPSPDLGGYTPITADVKTTIINGATHTFVYKSDAKTVALSAGTAYQIDENLANAIYNLYNESKTLMSAANVDFSA